MTDRFAEIRPVLQTYFDALYTCDVTLLAQVFHPRAVYATADETPPLIRSMEEYFPVVEKRISPMSRNEARRDVIDSIDLAGDNTAMARVRCRINAHDFTDFLTLIREDGQWRIMSKVFAMTERKEAR
ncbi:nuclear transport factor 2 family protein [Roseovarius sp. CAU 1744]|uniref:nuclear transport factor 2 family protein n=1 Tax=Roseovarius sp. CAU 1744 TaxID=3140368 RepID=UPI00325A8166